MKLLKLLFVVTVSIALLGTSDLASAETIETIQNTTEEAGPIEPEQEELAWFLPLLLVVAFSAFESEIEQPAYAPELDVCMQEFYLANPFLPEKLPPFTDGKLDLTKKKQACLIAKNLLKANNKKENPNPQLQACLLQLIDGLYCDQKPNSINNEATPSASN